VRDVLPTIIYNERILIEAGTPFINEKGWQQSWYRRYWYGDVVADLKVADAPSVRFKLLTWLAPQLPLF
jgi:3-keto-L-gulonate-6-phosphate decarboxylase